MVLHFVDGLYRGVLYSAAATATTFAANDLHLVKIIVIVIACLSRTR